jgi:hypothetical protein
MHPRVPPFHDGIKKFDPLVLLQALLAKIMVRGLVLRLEPWKVLL